MKQSGHRPAHPPPAAAATLPSRYAIRLQEAMGFTKVAHFREVGCKFGRWLDVAYFEKVLGDSEPETPGPR